MGTGLPEPSPPGPFANFCWTTGAFLNPEDPPKFMTVELSGLLKGDLWGPPDPEPPNGRFVLEQTNTIEWSLNIPEIAVAVAWSSVNTAFIIFIIPSFPEVTFSATSSTCQTLLPNIFNTAAGRRFYSGTIEVLGIS